MKPGDHPDFYRFAPPSGTSRESHIVLDRDGRFWHEGGLIERGPLALAFARWLSRHPDDGRYILTNGYDWCYLRVEGTPYIVEGVSPPGQGQVTITLSDGSSEPLVPSALSVGVEDAVYAKVKGGAFEARFSRHAQAQLAPYLGDGDEPVVIAANGERAALGERQRPA